MTSSYARRVPSYDEVEDQRYSGNPYGNATAAAAAGLQRTHSGSTSQIYATSSSVMMNQQQPNINSLHHENNNTNNSHSLLRYSVNADRFSSNANINANVRALYDIHNYFGDQKSRFYKEFRFKGTKDHSLP